MPAAVPFRFPRALAVSPRFTVTVDGHPFTALTTSAGDFCQWEFHAPVEVVVHSKTALTTATVRPLHRGLAAKVTGGAASVTIPAPGRYVLEIDGGAILYLFAEEPPSNKPQKTNPSVRYFAAGQVYEVGELTLAAGDTLYLEGGAVLRGAIRVASADHVRIAGCGIIDNSYFPRGGPETVRRAIFAEFSAHLKIEDVLIIEPATWTIEVAACEDVSIDGVKILGSLIASDGIDIVGCERVEVRECLIRSGDDCVCIKSVEYGQPVKNAAYCRDVHDVLVERCILHSFGGGSALEIGFELRCEEVSRIVFRDIDILAVHEWGAAFAIHNTDRAVVHDVLYEDIRVEHYWVWLFDVRIVDSRYALDRERGHIRDITFRRLAVTRSPYNTGVSTSHFGGYDATHRVERIHFEDCRYGGAPFTSLDSIDGYARHAGGITFDGVERPTH